MRPSDQPAAPNAQSEIKPTIASAIGFPPGARAGGLRGEARIEVLDRSAIHGFAPASGSRRTTTTRLPVVSISFQAIRIARSRPIAIAGLS